jgi:glycosyltransferase involved in cell wall biosynthesis
MITINTRNLNAHLTGIQRYTQEIIKRLPSESYRTIKPAQALPGPVGHAWEQCVLPTQLQGQLLWSPSNTGPLVVKRQVVTVHDLATFDSPEGFSNSFRAAYAFILPRLLPRVAHILTVSEFTKQCLIERFKLSADKITVTPLGVDHDRFYPRSAKEIQELKHKLQLSSRYILFLGSLSARKNMRRLVEAWALAQHDVDADIELVIAGGAGVGHVFNGTELPTLPPRTRLLGRIADEDLPALYSGATLFAFPSLYEGFGLPPLEAIACGTPVLSSQVSSLPEVLGNVGILVDPLRVEEICDGLHQALNNRGTSDKMSKVGVLRAQAFQWQKTAQQTYEVLKTF